MGTIRVSEFASSAELSEARAIMSQGGEFATSNGEMPDAVARALAAEWQSPGSVGHVLASLASGAAVDRDALMGDVEATGRSALPMWPTELEYLATWVLNHA